jgi:SAM-dependent methyltransferase
VRLANFSLGLGIGRRLGLASYLARPKKPVRWWTRIVMDRETEAYVRRLDYRSMAALEISGKKWADFGFRSYRRVGWPDYDWSAGTVEGTYDFIVAEQVLEHLERPVAALTNAHAMLAEDGLLLVTTPFLIRIHEYPIDCYRWTPHGLRQLLMECGFRHVETGAWGNRRCVRANFGEWVEYVPWRHSLRNESAYPVVVWAFAWKRARDGDAGREVP